MKNHTSESNIERSSIHSCYLSSIKYELDKTTRFPGVQEVKKEIDLDSQRACVKLHVLTVGRIVCSGEVLSFTCM